MVSVDRHVAKLVALLAKPAAMMASASPQARVLPIVTVSLVSVTMVFAVMRASAKTLNNV